MHWTFVAPNIMRISAIGAAAAVGFSTALTSIFSAILVITCLFSWRLIDLLRQSFSNPISKMVLIFFTVLVFGCFVGSVSLEKCLDSLWSWRKVFFIVILIPIFYDELWKKKFLAIFLATSLLGLLISSLSWLGLIEYQIDNAPGVVLQNWATQGMIFAVSILILYYQAEEFQNWSRKVSYGLAFIFLLNIIFITPGRSGYIALGAVLITIGVSKYGLKRLPLIGICLVAFGFTAYLLSPSMQEKVNAGFRVFQEYKVATKPPLNSETFRLMAYENTLELIKERSLIGHGTGSFENVFGNHVKYKYSDWRNRKISDPHNQYLFIVFENGLIGLLIFVCFLLSPFFLKLQKKDSFYYIGIGVLLTWLTTSFFSSHFRTFSEGHLVAFFIGVMFSSQNRLITRR
ncbi:MAG: hypothetical protein CMK56_02305 [Proteobacteria bacterium]|nr:hypothetical protein [Pseudomonadota bacterium]